MAMAFKKHYRLDETIRKIILVLLTYPLVASSNIDCGGKAFHCVNSTHFMVCVDLGDGVSSTIDNFVIACPLSTQCQKTNYYECEIPLSTSSASTIDISASSALMTSENSTVEEERKNSTSSTKLVSEVSLAGINTENVASLNPKSDLDKELFASTATTTAADMLLTTEHTTYDDSAPSDLMTSEILTVGEQIWDLTTPINVASEDSLTDTNTVSITTLSLQSVTDTELLTSTETTTSADILLSTEHTTLDNSVPSILMTSEVSTFGEKNEDRTTPIKFVNEISIADTSTGSMSPLNPQSTTENYSYTATDILLSTEYLTYENTFTDVLTTPDRDISSTVTTATTSAYPVNVNGNEILSAVSKTNTNNSLSAIIDYATVEYTPIIENVTSHNYFMETNDISTQGTVTDNYSVQQDSIASDLFDLKNSTIVYESIGTETTSITESYLTPTTTNFSDLAWKESFATVTTELPLIVSHHEATAKTEEIKNSHSFLNELKSELAVKVSDSLNYTGALENIRENKIPTDGTTYDTTETVLSTRGETTASLPLVNENKISSTTLKTMTSTTFLSTIPTDQISLDTTSKVELVLPELVTETSSLADVGKNLYIQDTKLTHKIDDSILFPKGIELSHTNNNINEVITSPASNLATLHINQAKPTSLYYEIITESTPFSQIDETLFFNVNNSTPLIQEEVTGTLTTSSVKSKGIPLSVIGDEMTMASTPITDNLVTLESQTDVSYSETVTPGIRYSQHELTSSHVNIPTVANPSDVQYNNESSTTITNSVTLEEEIKKYNVSDILKSSNNSVESQFAINQTISPIVNKTTFTDSLSLLDQSTVAADFHISTSPEVTETYNQITQSAFDFNVISDEIQLGNEKSTTTDNVGDTPLQLSTTQSMIKPNLNLESVTLSAISSQFETTSEDAKTPILKAVSNINKTSIDIFASDSRDGTTIINKPITSASDLQSGSLDKSFTEIEGTSTYVSTYSYEPPSSLTTASFINSEQTTSLDIIATTISSNSYIAANQSHSETTKSTFDLEDNLQNFDGISNNGNNLENSSHIKQNLIFFPITSPNSGNNTNESYSESEDSSNLNAQIYLNESSKVTDSKIPISTNITPISAEGNPLSNMHRMSFIENITESKLKSVTSLPTYQTAYETNTGSNLETVTDREKNLDNKDSSKAQIARSNSTLLNNPSLELEISSVNKNTESANLNASKATIELQLTTTRTSQISSEQNSEIQGTNSRSKILTSSTAAQNTSKLSAERTYDIHMTSPKEVSENKFTFHDIKTSYDNRFSLNTSQPGLNDQIPSAQFKNDFDVEDPTKDKTITLINIDPVGPSQSKTTASTFEVTSEIPLLTNVKESLLIKGIHASTTELNIKPKNLIYSGVESQGTFSFVADNIVKKLSTTESTIGDQILLPQSTKIAGTTGIRVSTKKTLTAEPYSTSKVFHVNQIETLKTASHASSVSSFTNNISMQSRYLPNIAEKRDTPSSGYAPEILIKKDFLNTNNTSEINKVDTATEAISTTDTSLNIHNDYKVPNNSNSSVRKITSDHMKLMPPQDNINSQNAQIRFVKTEFKKDSSNMGHGFSFVTQTPIEIVSDSQDVIDSIVSDSYIPNKLIIPENQKDFITSQINNTNYSYQTQLSHPETIRQNDAKVIKERTTTYTVDSNNNISMKTKKSEITLDTNRQLTERQHNKTYKSMLHVFNASTVLKSTDMISNVTDSIATVEANHSVNKPLLLNSSYVLRPSIPSSNSARTVMYLNNITEPINNNNHTLGLNQSRAFNHSSSILNSDISFVHVYTSLNNSFFTKNSLPTTYSNSTYKESPIVTNKLVSIASFTRSTFYPGKSTVGESVSSPVFEINDNVDESYKSPEAQSRKFRLNLNPATSYSHLSSNGNSKITTHTPVIDGTVKKRHIYNLVPKATTERQHAPTLFTPTMRPTQTTLKAFPVSRSPETGHKANNLLSFCRHRHRGRYSDRDDCSKFYICIGRSEPIVGRCPANTVFSDVNKQCTKNMAHCVRNNKFKCLSDGRFADINKENVYYICVKRVNTYVRFEFRCQKGYKLDNAAVRCVQEKDNHQSNSMNKKESETGSSESKNSKEKKHHKEDKRDRDKVKDEFECINEGKFVDPNNCKKYYVCTKHKKSEFRRRRKSCDSDERFHKDKKKCVDADSYEC